MQGFTPIDFDLQEQNFLHHVRETKNYDLLKGRIDYIQRQITQNKDLVYELYIDLCLAKQQEILTLINSKCNNISSFACFKCAIKRKVKLSDLNMKLDKFKMRHYYIGILEADCLELFLAQEEQLRTVLSEDDICLLVVESSSESIVYHLCKEGKQEAIIKEYFSYGKNTLKDKQFKLLSSVCVQYCNAEFLTKLFVAEAWRENKYTCQLLLQLGAQPSQKQKQEILRLSPAFHRKLFAEDV